MAGIATATGSKSGNCRAKRYSLFLRRDAAQRRDGRCLPDKFFAFTRPFPYMEPMQSQNPLLDELAKAASAAVGLAQAAGDEAKAAFRSGVDRMTADMDLIRRDEFEALKAEVASLRTELASLKQPGQG